MGEARRRKLAGDRSLKGKGRVESDDGKGQAGLSVYMCECPECGELMEVGYREDHVEIKFNNPCCREYELEFVRGFTGREIEAEFVIW